jgi:cytochrome c oxidase cbb3-type subunit 3
MKKSLLVFFCALLSLYASAQETVTEKKFWDDPIHHPQFPVYVSLTFVMLVIIMVAVVALYTVRVFNMMSAHLEKEKAVRLGKVFHPRPTLWSRVTQRANASIPIERENEIELAHSYDGIRELDNHLPPWWKWLFYATIAWSVVYIFLYHVVDTLPLQESEYTAEVTAAEEQSQRAIALQPKEAIDESNLMFTKDAAIIEKGKSVFMSNNCSSCHRNDGGGNTIGPNLTDEYWLHGGHIKNVFSTINHGVVDKGMPAWGKVMSPQDVRNVTFFVMSLQGTKPENAKAPQGELYADEQLKNDTLKISASL